jgi:hypothetical protein
MINGCSLRRGVMNEQGGVFGKFPSANLVGNRSVQKFRK